MKQQNLMFYLSDFCFEIKTPNDTIYKQLKQFLVHSHNSQKIFATICIELHAQQLCLYVEDNIKIFIPSKDLHIPEDLFFVIKFYIQKYLKSFPYILLHGSAVLFKDYAYLFMGPSGAGKSTISRNSLLPIIADDLCVISLQNGLFYVGGSSLDIKQKKHVNIIAPIKHIYFLHKSSNNTHQLLSTSEKTEKLLLNTILAEGEYEENKLNLQFTNKKLLQEKKKIIINRILALANEISCYNLFFVKEYVFKPSDL